VSNEIWIDSTLIQSYPVYFVAQHQFRIISLGYSCTSNPFFCVRARYEQIPFINRVARHWLKLVRELFILSCIEYTAIHTTDFNYRPRFIIKNRRAFALRTPTLLNLQYVIFYFLNHPMLRHVPNPLNPRILHFDVGVEAFGDHMADQSLSLFLQQVNKGLLFGNQV